MAPTWPSKSTKIHEKSMPRCLPIMTSFFDRFLFDFCSQLGLPNQENSSPHCSESTIFLKSHFDVHMDFWFDFGANLAPFWLPKSSKILPKIDPKRHQIFDRFLHRFFLHFGSLLGPKLGPCWPHFPQKWGEAVEGPPPLLLGLCYFSIFWSSWPHLRPILAPFWRLWAQLGLDFGGCWLHYCTLLALCRVLRAQEAGTGWAVEVTRSARNSDLILGSE